MFCPEPSCSSVFESEQQFEEHTLNEDHTSVKESSSMDETQASFVKKMKLSSAAHQVTSNTMVKLSELSRFSAVQGSQLFSEVSIQGWALPRMNYFRYTYAQKKFLYDIFMEFRLIPLQSS